MSKIRFDEEAIGDNPPTGKIVMGIDESDSELYTLDSSGTVRKYIPGAGDMDKSIYDAGGLELNVYDKANETGIEQITGNIITPAVLVVDTSDYNPTDFAIANMIRQDFTGNNLEISGMVAPGVGINRIVRICNINTSGEDLRFTNNDASSLAANRFLMRDGAQKSIKPNETGAFWYDHISLRWRPYNRVG